MPVRECQEIAIVAVDNAPAMDLLSALPNVDAGFAMATYAESELAAKLARVLERLAGPIDLSFRAIWQEVVRRTRTASVHGDLRVGNGRRDPAFFGGHARLIRDMRLWEHGELSARPIQLGRLRELEAAGIDIVEFPTNPAVDIRFGGLNLAQPVVISIDRLREAEASGRMRVEWSS